MYTIFEIDFHRTKIERKFCKNEVENVVKNRNSSKFKISFNEIFISKPKGPIFITITFLCSFKLIKSIYYFQTRNKCSNS